MPPSIEDLYITEGQTTREVLGVQFTLRPITGQEYMSITQDCLASDGRTLDRPKYVSAIINAVVVEPKGVKVEKLKPAALALLANEIEDWLGLTEVARKNLPQ